MSWRRPLEPGSLEPVGAEGIEATIVPRPRDLGGFEVRRSLPAAERQSIGPFVFFDQAGPTGFRPGAGIDVRPHPHIGLATVTYLFSGALQHRDSLGTDIVIRPGAVNWMIAGRGIAHSERTAAGIRQGAHRLFAIQTWIALPKRHEETDPAFEHHSAGALPVLEAEGKWLRVILGDAYGETAPASTFGKTLYADAKLAPAAVLPLPEGHEERAAYVVEGSLEVAGDSAGAGRMLVFGAHEDRTLVAGPAGARLLLLGGERLDGPRHIWWNFVSSSKDRIEQAKEDWRQGRFALPPNDRDEFIPLPG
ncbi:MAG: pirin family protein [Rhodospirillales bacterium]|nr:pirin family protein [Rhodospirillales bacterium]